MYELHTANASNQLVCTRVLSPLSFSKLISHRLHLVQRNQEPYRYHTIVWKYDRKQKQHRLLAGLTVVKLYLRQNYDLPFGKREGKG